MAAGAILLGASIAGGIAGSYLDASEIRLEGRVAETEARMRARSARVQAKDAIDRGYRQRGIINSRMNQLTGAQKVALSAQGIDPYSGTAASTIIESRYFGEMDAIDAITNARLEALGFKAEALASESAARLASISARRKAKLTILGGFLGAGSATARFFADRKLNQMANKPIKTPMPKPKPNPEGN